MSEFFDVLNEWGEYTDKVERGYMYEKEENTPLTISYTESDNVIKVYYVTNPEDKKPKDIIM